MATSPKIDGAAIQNRHIENMLPMVASLRRTGVSKLTPREKGAEAAIPPQKQRMEQSWRKIVPICERDAP
ncbi:MAG: hypothetical protein ACYC7D_04475 [Nitrososphaerales archaeon]